MTADIRALVRDYILQGDGRRCDPAGLTDRTPLASCGLLDSIAIMKLVIFLEAEFGIEFTPHDLDRRSLETIADIEALVRAKLAVRGDATPD